ncbi:MAG: hypothetical protein WC905_02520 [Patescibacteria group bacterium]|jgi:hypothetical protein
MNMRENNEMIKRYAMSLLKESTLGLRFIDNWDFRYPNTLRIYFNKSVGLGSWGDTVEEVPIDDLGISSEEAQKLIPITEIINDFINMRFNKYIPEMDWRDDKEVEIHFNNKSNPPGDEEIMSVLQQLDMSLIQQIS